jgi:hypothetical protein
MEIPDDAYAGFAATGLLGPHVTYSSRSEAADAAADNRSAAPVPPEPDPKARSSPSVPPDPADTPSPKEKDDEPMQDPNFGRTDPLDPFSPGGQTHTLGTPLANIIQRANAQGALAIGAALPMVAAWIKTVAPRIQSIPWIRRGSAFANSPQGRQLSAIAGAGELIDIATPGVDLPTVSDIPGWAVDKIRRAGVTIADLFDRNGSGGNGPPSLGEDSGFGPGVTVLNSWDANGVWFYRLSNGWTWHWSVHKGWGKYKQVKPLVLMPNGASDLRTLLRVIGVASGQLKSIDKALKSKLGPNRRTRSAPQRPRQVTGRIVNIDND